MTTPRERETRRPSLTALSALLVVCSLAFAVPAHAQQRGRLAPRFSARVVAVADGDTISVFHERQAVKVRLEGIDCPELGQPYGRVARLFTSGRVFGKQVDVVVNGRDRYGRLVGRVYVANEELGKALLAAGLAWHYTEYSSDKDLHATEMTARRQRVGLWAQPNPVPPWVARRRPSIGTANRSPANEKPAAAPRPGASAPSGPFHGNVKSRVFHAPGCPNYNCTNCTAVFATRDDALREGYKPAGDCAGRR